MSNENSDYYFLRGGGEMGELIRAKDWGKTSLGHPKDWPQALRTMVAVMLDNPFGMYIAWGNDYTQLYNDGYRPILGATKHPQALGISTRETFSEIWEIIGPMFEGVMQGKAVGFPDLMLPLNRNGFIEECYFDFSYSPIRKDDGEVGGVLVTVIETTSKKQAEETLKESDQRFRNTMKQAPVGITVLRGPEYIVEMANDTYLQLVDKSESEFVGNPLFATLPEVEEAVHSLLDNVLNTGIPYHGNEVAIPVNRYGKQDVFYFDFLYHPLKEEDGKISGVIATVTEVTEKVETRKKIEDSEKRYNLMLMRSPFAFLILKGSDMVVHLANASMKDMLGKGDLIEGNTIMDILPELKGQPLLDILDNVYLTGIPFTANEMLVKLTYDGILAEMYLNFVCQPYHEADGTIAGVAVIAYNVTSAVKANKKIQENEKQFNTLANNIQNLAWMANADGWIYWYNRRWLEYTGLTLDEMQGWGWQKVHHPDHVERVLEMSKRLWQLNETFELTFPLRRHDGEYRWFLTRGYPVLDENKKITQWIGTNTDITEQVEAEEQFRQLADRMPQKVWTADALGNRNYFNQVMLDYTGMTTDELKGWGWKKIVHPDDWPQTKEKWEHSILTGEDFENKNRLLGKDGKYLWHLIRANAIKDDSGKPKIWIGSKTEIQEQIELSETLRENLQSSNEQMQTILQHAPDAVISIDEEGIITSWNPEAELIFGWKAQDVIGKTLTETIIPKRYREGHDRGMKHYLTTGEGPVINKPVELSAIKKHGIEIPVELKISATKVNDQHIFIGFIRDISIRKQSEETIQNKTNQLLEAQQLAHIGSWEWDVPANKISWSDELYRIFGLTPQAFDADYENYLKYIHADDREFVNSVVQQALIDHEPYTFFHRVERADGEVRILSSTGKVFIDSNGNVTRMSGTAQDVTEQKKYEQELQISEERFYKIFDSNPVPMSLSDIKTNKIKYANNLFCNAFGYTKGEVIGNSTEELNLMSTEEYNRVINLIMEYLEETRSLSEVQALSQKETEAVLQKLKQSEKMKDFEICYTRKNGETFPALVSFEIIRIGTESYTVTSYHDITERKKAESQLKKQNNELEKMNKELESFAYISSHDLQEPLRKIQTFASRIIDKEESNLSDSAKDMFNRIQNAANRMQKLILDLLAYSSTKALERKFENTDLNKIIEDVKEELVEELAKKHATIETTALCEVNIIPFQFRQLMHNLIGNSLKFSKPNQPLLIQIKAEMAKGIKFNNVKLSPQNKYCRITVSDNGIGFEAEHNEKIFEVFQRLHSGTDYNGTGIGLAIVKRIMDNHNGFIAAYGAPNHGATFEIYIPA